MNKDDTIKALYGALKPVQQEMFRAFFETNQRKTMFHCARRLGKTHLLCTLAIIFAINKPNSQVRYASVTQKAVRKMIHPIFKQINLQMPTKFRGRYNSQEGAYVFPNGSMVHVAGVNNGHSDDLRGTASDLAIIDEAAFVDELSYLTESVLMPQLLTVPGSKLIMASSSPLSPAHEMTSYIESAQVNNAYHNYTIFDGGYSDDLVAEFCKEAGGKDSTTWRREYMNELIVDEQMSVIPEWKDVYVKAVEADELNKYYHRYESMDLGIRDKTVWLQGYYDFRKAALIIENEFDISGKDTTTKAIAELIKTNRKVKPHSAVADNNNLLLLNDLSTEFGLYFSPVNKDSLAAMINDVRLLVQDGRIIVNPKCKQLIGCLKFGVYQDHKRDMFGRSQTFGHYDALASLIYMVRYLDKSTNPIPRNHKYTINTFDPNYEIELEESVQNIKTIFSLR